MRDRFLSVILGLLVMASTGSATSPGGIDVTCDVQRTGTPSFRSAAAGQSNVAFRLWSAATGGGQLGSDYVVPMGSLAVAKRYTDKYDSVTPRKAVRINATIGSDGSPVLLPANGQAWLEVMVGSTTLGCDFAATGNPTARRRLQSVAFSRESNHSETCETCRTSADASARVFNSTTTSIASDAVVALAFDSERWDTDNIHDAVNPTRLTARTAGKYLIFGEVIFDANATGNRTVFIRENQVDADVLARVNVPAASIAQTTLSRTAISISTHAQLGQGDFVELYAVQNSGGVLNVGTPSEGVSEFGMVKLP